MIKLVIQYLILTYIVFSNDFYNIQSHKLNDTVSFEIERLENRSIIRKFTNDKCVDSIFFSEPFDYSFISDQELFFGKPLLNKSVLYILNDKLELDSIKNISSINFAFNTKADFLFIEKIYNDKNVLYQYINKDSLLSIANYDKSFEIHIYNYKSKNENIICYHNPYKTVIVKDRNDTLANLNNLVYFDKMHPNDDIFYVVSDLESNRFNVGSLSKSNFSHLTKDIKGDAYQYNFYSPPPYLVLSIDIDSLYINYYDEKFDFMKYRSLPKTVNLYDFKFDRDINSFDYNTFFEYSNINLHPDSSFNINLDGRVSYHKFNNNISYFLIRSDIETNKYVFNAYSGHKVYKYPYKLDSLNLEILNHANIIIALPRGSIENGYQSYLEGIGIKKQNTIDDICLLADSIKSNGNDIYYYGTSHGGFLGVNISIKRPDLFKEIIAENPVLDIEYLSKINTRSNFDYGNNEIVFDSLSPNRLINKAKNIGNLHLLFGGRDVYTPKPLRYKFYKRAKELNPNVTLNVVDSVHHHYMDHPYLLRKYLSKRREIIINLINKW